MLDETLWQDGSPSERALVVFLAGMSRAELDRFLRAMATRALSELEAADPDRNLASIRAALSPTQQPQIIDEAEWAFPGGDFLLDALQAIEASDRLWANALKSLSHALQATQLIVGAVVEHRDHQRDPAGWRRWREQLARGPTDPGTERRMKRQHDRQETWRSLLRGR